MSQIVSASSREAVVITAASSTVGLAAIQIVKTEGAVAIATTRTSQKRAELISLGADGRFRPKISRTFPLDQVVDAYKFLESNAQVGKIVITV
jgi:NADPH:quinone reductase-like Zn-dependent oxidoreductase